jgi:hypothetical protein
MPMKFAKAHFDHHIGICRHGPGAMLVSTT